MRFGERTRSGTSVSDWTQRPTASGIQWGTATSSVSSSITDTVSYTLHSFTATGTFTVTKAGVFELLIVGGGGGGGSDYVGNGENGGGGSAGQVLQCFAYLDANTYTATVGAAGAGGASGGAIYYATNSAISIAKIEASGGVSGAGAWGGGGSRAYNGSGASYRSGYGGNPGGVAMGVYGYNGGASDGGGNNGGGGGAGGAGGTRTRGAGVTLTFTGSSITWGEGGLGGGSFGAQGSAPTANRGGGGSGGIGTSSGGQNGAAGAVYVRHR